MKTQKELTDAIIEFMDHIREKLDDSMLPVELDFLKKYVRTTQGHSRAAVCFIALYDSETKTLGRLRQGDVLKPASYYGPTKIVRANVFVKPTWEGLFGKFGMNGMR